MKGKASPKTRYFIPPRNSSVFVKMWAVNDKGYTVYYKDRFEPTNGSQAFNWDGLVKNGEIFEISESEAALLV